jgi:hypothetical protein
MSLHRHWKGKSFYWLWRGTAFSFTELQIVLDFYRPQLSSSALHLLKMNCTVNFLFCVQDL